MLPAVYQLDEQQHVRLYGREALDRDRLSSQRVRVVPIVCPVSVSALFL